MNKQASPDPNHQASDPSWFERNVSLIIIGLIVACVLSVLATFFPGLDHEHHHPHFEQEGWLGFQAEDGIRDRSPSRGLGDVYKRQLKRYESWIFTTMYGQFYLQGLR